MIWGIDFGAKLSGNTALSVYDGKEIMLFQSSKSVDAGSWLHELCQAMPPSLIGIDAPLSLPPGYFHSGEDLHFREADRQLGAMSPMFIGGLTARAIEWASGVDAQIIEVYPSALADLLYAKGRQLRKSDPQWFFENVILPALKIELSDDLVPPVPANIHQLDALLALLAALRYRNGNAIAYGNEKEGKIWV